MSNYMLYMDGNNLKMFVSTPQPQPQFVPIEMAGVQFVSRAQPHPTPVEAGVQFAHATESQPQLQQMPPEAVSAQFVLATQHQFQLQPMPVAPGGVQVGSMLEPQTQLNSHQLPKAVDSGGVEVDSTSEPQTSPNSHQPPKAVDSGGVEIVSVMESQSQLQAMQRPIPMKAEGAQELLKVNLRQQKLSTDLLTQHRRRLQRSQAVRIAKIREVRQAQLLQWRYGKDGRRGIENLRQMLQRRRQPYQPVLRPLTQTQQQVVAELLPLQNFWTFWRAIKTQLKENSHQKHITAVTRVIEDTLQDLKDRFTAENLPENHALTSTLVNAITNFGEKQEALPIFLKKLGIVRTSVPCFRHPRPVPMTQRKSRGCNWQCYYTIQGKKCHKSWSFFKGTIFEGSRLPLEHSLLTILHILRQDKWSEILNDVLTTGSCLLFWKKRCRDYFIKYNTQKSRIGGPGTVVEIQEFQFRGKNYKVGHKICMCIVLRGIERSTAETFVARITDKASRTLCSVIVKFVAPGGTVITDQHAGYTALRGLGYTHKVRHNFLNPQDRCVYTDAIERKWMLTKHYLKRYMKDLSVHTDGVLAEYVFHNDCVRENVHPSIKFLALLRGKKKSCVCINK